MGEVPSHSAQLAGDLLPAATPEERRRQLTATAFLALGPTNYEEQNKDQLRMDIVDEQIDTLGKAFLGLTLGCARCHDHKFDPLPQRDFYALSAFFANIDEAGAIPYKNFSDLMPPPVLKLPDAAAEAAVVD